MFQDVTPVDWYAGPGVSEKNSVFITRFVVKHPAPSRYCDITPDRYSIPGIESDLPPRIRRLLVMVKAMCLADHPCKKLSYYV